MLPSQAHWILEVAKYCFEGALVHLVASVPGIYSPRNPYVSHSKHDLSGKQKVLKSSCVNLLGSVETFVVGLSHLFRTSVDSNGLKLQKLATFLGQCCENAYGLSEILLRREINILADLNAVSVLVLIGPMLFRNFGGHDMSACFCFLLTCCINSELCKPMASSGGSSSVGSVNAKFLATFSAAAGKRAVEASESEESDQYWGCWSASQELKKPSIKIIFHTIERVKNARCGILASKYILCFSQKTWQRLKSIGILHDAIPYPRDRVRFPTHVKVARRGIQSKSNATSLGWVYCGSHNFSAAAWGRPLPNTVDGKTNINMSSGSILGSRLHVCNYKLGAIFIVPPSDSKVSGDEKFRSLDDIVLPFVSPAPKYRPGDEAATAQAVREVLTEPTELEKEINEAVAMSRDC